MSGYFLLSIGVLSQYVLALLHLQVLRSCSAPLPCPTHGFQFRYVKIISASTVLAYIEVVVQLRALLEAQLGLVIPAIVGESHSLLL